MREREKGDKEGDLKREKEWKREREREIGRKRETDRKREVGRERNSVLNKQNEEERARETQQKERKRGWKGETEKEIDQVTEAERNRERERDSDREREILSGLKTSGGSGAISSVSDSWIIKIKHIKRWKKEKVIKSQINFKLIFRKQGNIITFFNVKLYKKVLKIYVCLFLCIFLL